MPKFYIPGDGIILLQDVHLSQYTTFQLGGPAAAMISCQTINDLECAVKDLYQKEYPYLLIGGGSNLVVSDAGVDCCVIRYYSATPIIHRENNYLTVSASSVLDDVAVYACEQGLAGLNYTSGIPGTVGGAIVGNAGAFGKQVGDVCHSVTLINPQGIRETVQGKDLGFAYRHSNLKESNQIVGEVTFRMSEGDVLELQKERAGILKTRSKKHPNLALDPCAGSFFRNIEPTSQAGRRQAAGWFLDQAGGKALSYGGAGIYSKHANIIVKRPGCKSQDVYELSLLMAQLAKEHFDLDLVREVRFVGDFSGAPSRQNAWIW